MDRAAEPRNEAAAEGGDVHALAQRVDDLQQQVDRMQKRQRAVMKVVAAGHGHLFREIEALLQAG